MQPPNLDFLIQTADRVRTSLWFIPGLLTMGAIALATLTVYADDCLRDILPDEIPLVFSGSPDSARSVLSTIAGSAITIAGVVFSMTIVSLQLASSQFGPRLLRTFLRDRGNQVVLGGFVATFLYCILVLTVASGADPSSEIPRISITIAVLLAIFSLGLLVYYIDHVAQSIHADAVIDAVAREMTEVIDNLYPEQSDDGTDPPPRPATDRESEPVALETWRPGFVHSINADSLVELAARHDLLIEPEKRPGDFVFDGDVIATITSGATVPEPLRRKLRDTFLLGPHRTALQDPRLAFEQLTEMAVRALSPGINDPTTATNCVRAIGCGLVRVAGRPWPPSTRVDAEGVVRLVLEPIPVDALARTSLEPIARNADTHLDVWIGILDVLRIAIDRSVRETDQRDLEALRSEIAERADSDVRGDAERRQVRAAATAPASRRD